MQWRNPTDRPIYVDRTRTRVVDETDPEVGFQLVGPRGEIPVEEAERLGLTKPETQADEAPPETKHVEAPPATKAAPPPRRNPPPPGRRPGR